MEIRNYEPALRAEVVALWNQAFSNPTGHNTPGQSIDRKVQVDDGLFFVAVDEGAVVGTVMAGYDGHRGWLYSVGVAPAFQRRGVGTRLVRHAEQVLKHLGCPKVNLQIRDDNERVAAFYESLGYVSEPRISMGKLMTE